MYPCHGHFDGGHQKDPMLDGDGDGGQNDNCDKNSLNLLLSVNVQKNELFPEVEIEMC